jgi:predicted nucleic acid-binding protein
LILVDTSIWVDHLRSEDIRLVRLLDDEQISISRLPEGDWDTSMSTFWQRQV